MKHPVFFLALSPMLGCSNGETGSTTVTIAESAEANATPASNAAPMESALTSVASARRPATDGSSSWQEALDHLSPDDAAYLTTKNESYFGALSFESAEEKFLLIRIGIPLPHEVLASRRMTLAELRNATASGNVKVSALYVDRLIDLALSTTTKPGAIAGDEAMGYAGQASFEIGRLRAVSNSAFIPYLDARLMSIGEPRPVYVVGAILGAMDRGDTRAMRILEAYGQDARFVDIAGAAMYYDSMKANDRIRR